jgi:hypothetical protein
MDHVPHAAPKSRRSQGPGVTPMTAFLLLILAGVFAVVVLVGLVALLIVTIVRRRKP